MELAKGHSAASREKTKDKEKVKTKQKKKIAKYCVVRESQSLAVITTKERDRLCFSSSSSCSYNSYRETGGEVYAEILGTITR